MAGNGSPAPFPSSSCSPPSSFGLLFAVVIPGRHEVNGQIFGIGLAITAYLLGVRHAFDADHIAAIDNTTRKFVADGKRPVTVGLFFSLGHSTVVFVMALFVAIGAKFVATLVSDDSTAHQTLGIIGTSISGLFLIVIGLINLVALLSIYRVWREAQTGAFDEAALEEALNSRGFFARLLRPAMKAIKRPGQLYPLGVLFGLGFDTATEISLLVLAGAGAATGLPWYAVLVLPLLFAAGMSLFDTLDGAFMQAAYQWAFIRPVRKVYYNLTTTGLSVAVALLIGGVELISVLHDKAGLTDPVTSWIAGHHARRHRLPHRRHVPAGLGRLPALLAVQQHRAALDDKTRRRRLDTWLTHHRTGLSDRIGPARLNWGSQQRTCAVAWAFTRDLTEDPWTDMSSNARCREQAFFPTRRSASCPPAPTRWWPSSGAASPGWSHLSATTSCSASTRPTARR